MVIWPWLIFVAVIGACVGSFLNVLIYRLPEGRSLWWPPSSCPGCGHRLAAWDNVPVLGWVMLGGRCRYCKAAISVQYPIVEALCSALCSAVFVSYYLTPGLGPTGFSGSGLEASWPVMAVHGVLLAALLGATVIDARLYVIPLQVTWTVAVVALLALPSLSAWSPQLAVGGVGVRWDQAAASVTGDGRGWPGGGTLIEFAGVVPRAEGRWLTAAIGGAWGLAVACLLLYLRALPRSFDEAEHPATDVKVAPAGADRDSPKIADGPSVWLAHPHPRREVLKELLFVLFPVAGAGIGWWAGGRLDPGWLSDWPVWAKVAGGVGLGYLVGGALIWGTRIAGTLGFGKEAMGLGDVHLLASVGAVLGPGDATAVFFIAPFVGLLWAAASVGIGRLVRQQVRVIPYGPHLAAATFLLMVFHQPIWRLFDIIYR